MDQPFGRCKYSQPRKASDLMIPVPVGNHPESLGVKATREMQTTSREAKLGEVGPLVLQLYVKDIQLALPRVETQEHTDGEAEKSSVSTESHGFEFFKVGCKQLNATKKII